MKTLNDLFLNDPTIWVLVSFVIFVALAYMLGRKKITAMLDGRIDRIRHQIESAQTMRDEALALLNQYKSGIEQAEFEAKNIIERARLQAAELREQAARDFEATMTRREDMLRQRIEQIERSAKEDLSRYATELAVRAAGDVMAAHLSPAQSQQLIDRSIAQISDVRNEPVN